MDKKHKNTKTEKLNIQDEEALQYRDEEYSNASRSNFGTRPIKRPSENSRPKIIKLFPNLTETDKHRKIEKTRKSKRVRKQRIKEILLITVFLVLTVVLICMTPLFNIKSIHLNGNDVVSKEIINAKIGDLLEKNLFSVSVSDIEKKLLEIPQIREVEVKRAIFPTRLKVEIKESIPVAYLRSGKTILVVDSNLRIVDDAGVFEYEALPSISGVSVSEYKPNEILNVKSEEKSTTLTKMLQTLETTGLVQDVNNLNIEDLSAITFRYANRIDVECGSSLQIERKIRMFAECIRTSEFDENSRGTVDLSVPGKAEYTP